MPAQGDYHGHPCRHTYIRTALSSLNHYMASVDSNIKKFNQHIDKQVKALTCQGEETHNLMINLFKGYRAMKDRQFVAKLHHRP